VVLRVGWAVGVAPSLQAPVTTVVPTVKDQREWPRASLSSLKDLRVGGVSLRGETHVCMSELGHAPLLEHTEGGQTDCLAT